MPWHKLRISTYNKYCLWSWSPHLSKVIIKTLKLRKWQGGTQKQKSFFTRRIELITTPLLEGRLLVGDMINYKIMIHIKLKYLLSIFSQCMIKKKKSANYQATRCRFFNLKLKNFHLTCSACSWSVEPHCHTNLHKSMVEKKR